jgi:hypothetical protein
VHEGLGEAIRQQEEPIALGAIEPAYLNRLEPVRHGAGRRTAARVRPRRLDRNDGHQRDRLPAARPLAHQRRHLRAGHERAGAVAVEQAVVQEHVAGAIIGHEKAIAAQHVEPLDRARQGEERRVGKTLA